MAKAASTKTTKTTKPKSTRREFLQLADTYAPGKHNIAGYYISEKLDGTRCFWDGGLTRDMRTEDVPWASVIDPKTGKRKGKIKPRSTGLWSRYGNPIIAPDWFLNQLPACPLDGELWAGRGKFQLCRSICGGDEADPRFDQIQYAVYSTPPLDSIFGSGEIKNANMVATFDRESIFNFYNPLLKKFMGEDDTTFYRAVNATAAFDDELMFLREMIESQGDRCFLHHQTKLPEIEDDARAFANEFLDKLLDQGAEGAVIRNPNSMWVPKRHAGLLKYKPFEDSEAEIIGYRAGKEGKQGNVLGKIGTLLVECLDPKMRGVTFEIGSGLTFADREFINDHDIAWAKEHPGEIVPEFFKGKTLRVGDTITFKYRELSDDGIPKEGRFWRKRDAE